MYVLGKQVTWSSKHTLHTHLVICSHPRAPLKFPHNPTFSHIHTLTHSTLSDTASTPQILIQSHMVSCALTQIHGTHAHKFSHTHTRSFTHTHTCIHTVTQILTHTISHTHVLIRSTPSNSQLHNLTFMHS